MMKNNIKKLQEFKKDTEAWIFKAAVINTLIEAPRFLIKYQNRFKNSQFDQTWSNFIAFLQASLPEDIEFELLDNKILIFKGAIEVDKFSTNASDLQTSKEK